ncbi:hypothetical protein AAG906_003770 [Vitis piasezkii]
MSEEFNALINPPGLLYLPLLLKMSLGVNGSFALNLNVDNAFLQDTLLEAVFMSQPLVLFILNSRIMFTTHHSFSNKSSYLSPHIFPQRPWPTQLFCWC